MTSSASPTNEGETEDATVRETTLDEICDERKNLAPGALKAVLALAVKIAREGREGRKVGTIFAVGDAEAVMAHSRPLILDPLAGHPTDARRIGVSDVRETLKELAVLDGGFVVSREGVVESAARYFDASSEGIELPLGLGSRHMAGASITKQTDAVAVVVSESSVVRLFENGRIVSEIIPELWMLRRHGTELFRESEAARRAADEEGGGAPAVVLESKER